MALGPSARPLWPVSALHSLALASPGNGFCVPTSISPCLLTRKSRLCNARNGYKRLCTYNSYQQETNSKDVRHSKFQGKADLTWPHKARGQKQKYPWKKEDDSGELPWHKENSSPKKHNGPYSLRKSSRDTNKRESPRDKQDMEFGPSRGEAPFGKGPTMHTAPWMQGWRNVQIKEVEKDVGKKKLDLGSNDDNLVQVQHFDGKRKTAMHRIVDKLRSLRIGEEANKRERGSNMDQDNAPSNNIGSLLEKRWGNLDKEIQDYGQAEARKTLLPWEREGDNTMVAKPKENRVKAPTLAELTIPDEELKRLRRLGIRLKDWIKIPKAGLTQSVLDKIHGQWKTSELVRLKFDEPYTENMKRAHRLSEEKTGGFVTWRAGGNLVLYRGSNYEPPSVKAAKAQAKISSGIDLLAEDNIPFVPDTVLAEIPNDKVKRRKTSDIMGEDGLTNFVDVNNATGVQLDPEIVTNSNEAQPVSLTSKMDPKKEINSILDGLGPRFIDWWGNDPLPVDADLLPEVVPNYKTPLRILPYGSKRSQLSNSELTNLRKLARPLPIHFALGRNRRLQGLAAAILKLWERCEIAKIAVKRGVQNTNNKLMAEELKKLTGGILLLRNKYFIIIYRGKDFLPPLVANVLAEKAAEAKVFQDEEEIARAKAAAAVQAREYDGSSLAGTLAETLDAQARWGLNKDPSKMREAAAEAKKAEATRRLQRKISIAQLKKQKAEKELAKLEQFLAPADPEEDRETITNEERFMFRRLGLRMNAFLLLGRRGVFDGVVENMHLHWKHRELVKIISKGNSLACTEDIARTLEIESGGILVTVENVSKGYAMIFYRGKNYQRPTKLRPQNLLNKRKAFRYSVERQRKESLSFHIYQMEQNIKQFKLDLSKADVDEDKYAPDSNSALKCIDSDMVTETEDEELDYENSDSSDHFYVHSENEEISSIYESEMDEIESIQNAETGAQALMSKELDQILKDTPL